MLGLQVEPGEDRPCLGRNDTIFVVLAGEVANRGQRLETHDHDELEFIRVLATKDLDALEPLELAILDADEDPIPEKGFIRVGVGLRGPSMPNARDHRWLLPWEAILAGS